MKHLSIPSRRNTASPDSTQRSSSSQSEQQSIAGLLPGCLLTLSLKSCWPLGAPPDVRAPLYSPFLFGMNKVSDFPDNEVLIKESGDRIRTSHLPFIS